MTATTGDRFAAARSVADAVLYEGYVLYPYRASSQKNARRWQFGVLTPRAFAEADGSERWSTRTECLLVAAPPSTVAVRIRFLQLQSRSVEAAEPGGGYVPVPSLEVDGTLHVGWEEAVERVVDLPGSELAATEGAGAEQRFSYGPRTDTEVLRDRRGRVAGRLVRRQEALSGLVRVELSPPVGTRGARKVAVVVENTSPASGRATCRDAALRRSLLSVHTMLAVDGGRWISRVEPPEDLAALAASCACDGSHPVLMQGDEVVLSSPIILYDHPEVAPESPGDLYDATEIDEILALRVLTLTDSEKAEARATDPRAAAVMDRCQTMAPEAWERLHGGFRGGDEPTSDAPGPSGRDLPVWDPQVDAAADPWSDAITVGGVRIAKGSPVTLRPRPGADAQDLFLAGRPATVAGVFHDIEGNAHVAVGLDDDPASAEWGWQGRYLFFHPHEVEPRRGGGGQP